jgi:hypothetical protein
MEPNDPRRSDPLDEPDPGEIPLGQRLFDRPFLLMVVGFLIMALFYTSWGLWEVMSMDPAPLP